MHITWLKRYIIPLLAYINKDTINKKNDDSTISLVGLAKRVKEWLE